MSIVRWQSLGYFAASLRGRQIVYTLFKDIISFGVAFYLISYYGRKAILAENQR